MLGSILVLLCLIARADAHQRVEFQPGHNPASSCTNLVIDPGLNRVLSDGGILFSLNLYDKLKGGTNVIFSPFSVRVVLAMAEAGAAGNTLSQMDKALLLDLFPDAVLPLLAFQSYLGSFCPDDKFSLSTANRIFMCKDYPIDPLFTNKIGKFYFSGAENVDFAANPAAATETINKWVELQTNSTIKNLISADSLNSETALVLVNAIYFKAKWKAPFVSQFTNPQTFTLASGQPIQVPTMYQKGHFNYTFSITLKSQVLQLNYEGDRVAMFIILPEKGTSLAAVKQTLNFNNILDSMNKLSIENVKVSLPKFKTKYRAELKAPLESLGMVDAFTGSADFGRMTSGPRVRVNQVVQQAFVAVDEEGTVAAAATMMALLGESPSLPEPPPVEFKVDRPCFYFIYDLKYGEILFMGNLDNPLS